MQRHRSRLSPLSCAACRTTQGTCLRAAAIPAARRDGARPVRHARGAACPPQTTDGMPCCLWRRTRGSVERRKRKALIASAISDRLEEGAHGLEGAYECAALRTMRALRSSAVAAASCAAPGARRLGGWSSARALTDARHHGRRSRRSLEKERAAAEAAAAAAAASAAALQAGAAAHGARRGTRPQEDSSSSGGEEGSPVILPSQVAPASTPLLSRCSAPVHG